MQSQRLIKSLLLVSILTPNIALSFTMADMEVNSALNEKLDAVIPISLAAHEKPHEINIKMAAPIVFEQHKISRRTLLDKIQFKRIGTAIKITSDSPINTPTLDFILEVNSRKGPSYQRYKITLSKNSLENKVSAQAIAASQLIPVAINVGPKPVAMPLATIAERLTNEHSFGPIQKNDTLAKIAKHIAKLRGLKTKKVQTALRYENPNAFYNGAHGALKVGEYLHIPDFNEAKPAEVAALAIAPILNTAPILTTNKIEPLNNAPIVSNVNVQQLQAKVEQLEHHVEQIQKDLAVLQTQALVNPSVSFEPKIVAETIPPLANPIQDTTSPEPAPNTDTNNSPSSPLKILDHPWLLFFIATSLLTILAWIVRSFVSNKRATNINSPSSKSVTETLKGLDINLLIPKKASSVAPRTTKPKTDNNTLDTQTEDIDSAFLKSQASNPRIKKLKRPSRYPADISDNLKK